MTAPFCRRVVKAASTFAYSAAMRADKSAAPSNTPDFPSISNSLHKSEKVVAPKSAPFDFRL